MKKLSLYIFLVLMFCNVGFADACIGNCNNGYGKYAYINIGNYAGEWKNGKRHGKGTFTFLDGSKYSGEWENGLGIIKKKNSDGTFYIIIYENNKLSKQEFKIDIPDGEGTHIYPDGSKYVGNFQDGFKHGKGTLIWNGNNGKYVGDFKNGFWHGKGSYALYKEDNHLAYLYYDGGWKYGMRHGDGDGEEEYPDGSKYIGSYIDDKRHGQGVMIFPDTPFFWIFITPGKRYEGNWINGKLTLYESCPHRIDYSFSYHIGISSSNFFLSRLIPFENLFEEGLISKEELEKIKNSKVELLDGSNYHGDIIFINMFCKNSEDLYTLAYERLKKKVADKEAEAEKKLKEEEAEKKLKEQKEAEEQKEKGEKLEKFILDNVITVDYDGKKQSYKFNKNNTYEVYENGKVAGEGKWTIKDLNKGSIELSGYQDIYFTIYKTKNDNNYTIESLPGKILSIVSLNDFEKQLAQIELEKQKALEQKKEAEEQKLKEAEEQKLKEAEKQKLKEAEEQKLKELEEQKKAEEQKLKEAEEQVCEKEITNEEGQKIVINECVNQ